jgi:hypothetical protein
MKKSRRKKKAAGRAAAALTAGAAIAAGTQAYADPIRFDNPAPGDPGHFDWQQGDGYNPLTWLDITRPSTDQGDYYYAYSNAPLVGQYFGEQPYVNYDFGPSGYVAKQYMGFPIYYHLTKAFAGGAVIDGSQYFDSLSDHVVDLSYYGYGVYSFFDITARYMGVAFEDYNGRTHYGWIGVTRNGTDLDAFAWGYETTAFTPIPAGIPEPGSLALLALGALAAVRRR